MTAIHHKSATAAQYVITRKAVKTARIRVTARQEVLITVPKRYSQRQVETLLADKQAWIENSLSHFRQHRPLLTVPAGHLLLFGEHWKISHQPQRQQAYRLDTAHKVAHTGLDLSDTQTRIAWLKQLAKVHIPPRVAELARQHGLHYQRLFIRSQRTKWGTCSSLGNISINYKLVQAPAFVLDYVIVHELTHTLHLNHSPVFWQKLASLFPDYSQAEAWLERYGHNL